MPPELWQPPPSRPSVLASVPRGFYETAAPDECDDTAPAFLRGILVPESLWAQKGLALLEFPRWLLYRGPFPLRQDAAAWDQFMFFWAHQNAQVWFGEGTPCIVRNHRLKWPADQTQRWDWVYETSPPRRVRRVWNAGAGAYTYIWE